MNPSILIVEDDLTFSTILKTWLGKKGFEVETVSTNARARKQLATRTYDLILSDLRLPDQDGIHLLTWLRSQAYDIPVIIMTSYAEIQSAVQAIKEGASDYIAKPVQPDELLKKSRRRFISTTYLISKVMGEGASKAENSGKKKAETAAKAETETSQNYLEGKSEAATQLYNYVRLVAPTQMSVLINGASGTGKEYVAHRIHELSKRSNKPLLPSTAVRYRKTWLLRNSSAT